MTGYVSPGPAAEELALLLCVAVRIEPELIRAVRLGLLPAYDVGVEGDLWFSDWIGHRSAEAVQLRTEIAESLRTELTRRLGDDPDGPLNRIWPVLHEVHGRLSPTLLLEEELQWAAVRVAAGLADAAEIDRVLQPALRAVVVEHRTGVVDWFTAAYRRLPELVRSSVTAWQLLQAAPRGELPVASPGPLDLTHIHALGDHVPTVNMPVRLDGDDLVLNETPMTWRHLLLPVPDTTPRLVRVRSGTHVDALVQIAPDRVERIEVGPDPVRITTGRGDVFEVGGPADAEAPDAPMEIVPVVAVRATMPLGTNRELRDLARALRTRRVRVDDELVAAVEARIARARAGEFETADSLRLLGWVLYEAGMESVANVESSWMTLSPEQRSLSEAAFTHTARLAAAARDLPQRHLAPRALGAIRAAAIAEAKRDTIEGYDAALALIRAVLDDRQDFRELAGSDVELDEMLVQLSNAHVGTVNRMAERVITRWAEEFAPAENESHWLERLHRELREAVKVGENALATAVHIGRQHGFVTMVTEDRLAVVGSPRTPALLTARACLLAAVISDGRPDAEHAAWMRTLADCYQAIDEPAAAADGRRPPLLTDMRRGLAQLRLGVALAFPGDSLPTSGLRPQAMGLDPLDDEAAEALSELLADERTSYRGDAGAVGGATMPAFIRAVEAARSQRSAVTTYRQWRRRWPSLDRYADESGRQDRVEAVLTLIDDDDRSDVGAGEVRSPGRDSPRALRVRVRSEAVKRAMARDDFLSLALDATTAARVVDQREALSRKVTNESELLSSALEHLDVAAGATESWATRAQAMMRAGVVHRFAEMAGVPVVSPSGHTAADLHAMSLRELGGSPPRDLTLAVVARYRGARDLRLAGRYAESLELSRVPPGMLFGSGADSYHTDFVYETGAAYISIGEPDQAGPLLDEWESQMTTMTLRHERRHRFDLIRALLRWESHDGRALDDLLTAQRQTALDGGIGPLSLTLTAAEFSAAAGQRTHALVVARRARQLIEELWRTDRVVGHAPAPLTMALKRACGDLAALAAELGDRNGADLGLRVALTAGRADLATAVRAGRSSLTQRVRSIIDDLVDGEKGMRPWPYRPFDVQNIRQELDATVSPPFTELVLPRELKVADLRKTIGTRYALDFTEITDNLGLKSVFRSGISSGAALTFARLAPETVEAATSLSGGTAASPSPLDGLLPVDLIRRLATAAGNPIEIVISANCRAGDLPWPALTFTGPSGARLRLIDHAVVTRTPLLTCVTSPSPPSVDGQALVRLVGLDDGGVDVQAERAAWDLDTDGNSVPASACHLHSADLLTSTGGHLFDALRADTYDFLHLAARGTGTGPAERLILPEGYLSLATATHLRWPRSALISAPIGGSGRFDLVLLLLSLGVKCLVVGVESASDHEIGAMAARVIRVLREGPVSLDVALRNAQLAAIAAGRPEREWTSLAAFVA
ncbi:hypothetical protein [Actinoplanes subglobosus]|uniref:CHAT domain-containing protein n=1 Tax=Actinoplanes subglobosus TaxID=1547892 RepID=A0ABV8J5A6_9ACTN